MRLTESFSILFIKMRILLPKFLASINLQEVTPLIRSLYMNDAIINKSFSFNDIIQFFSKNIQRARYEQLIIKLANAYAGYTFYLPAFLDFRGRIYRSGVLHFHERDLARSLIVFAGDDSSEMNKNLMRESFYALAFHYKSFDSYDEGYEWILSNEKELLKNVIGYVRCAKRQFQFLSHLIRINNLLTPITQDASASAYQIMSYLLLDECFAERTNLIPSSDGKIKDFYLFILEELKVFLHVELDKNLSTIVCNNLNRKIVKSIFMPMIYGKTVMSVASDLKGHLSHYITHKECFTVASACFKFWRSKYNGMESVIRLIRNIGWIRSAKNCPVFYKVRDFTTVQDYMIMKPVNIWIYDRLHKKRRRITLRVSSSQRDRRKTEIATFVHFIHQKDAHIAMQVVEKMQHLNAPIYTVHDNFISTIKYSKLLPQFYSNVIAKMGPPLSIINVFIYINIKKPILNEKLQHLDDQNEDLFAHIVIEKDLLHFYLKENKPEKQSKRESYIWDEKISGILSSYDHYTRLVCGNFQSQNSSWAAHEEKWNFFASKLVSTEEVAYNYCLHH
uniref:DNA-directed RNA polymerase n=1 Tax=Sesuvium portulacastrum TaxID=221166 RepID=A0A6B9ML55_SESPO|nr:DNA-dependent RNA polymerase [Sesuvium portulacastrum]